DGLDLKATTLDNVGETAGGADCRALADKALSLVDEALAQDNYVQARRLVSVAEKAARKAAATTILSRVEARGKEVELDFQAFQKVEKARRKLQDNRTDPEANFLVGKH